MINHVILLFSMKSRFLADAPYIRKGDGMVFTGHMGVNSLRYPLYWWALFKWPQGSRNSEMLEESMFKQSILQNCSAPVHFYSSRCCQSLFNRPPTYSLVWPDQRHIFWSRWECLGLFVPADPPDCGSTKILWPVCDRGGDSGDDGGVWGQEVWASELHLPASAHQEGYV